ncbi:hypothetical protein F2Q70_00008364 [Brassica cretica]|uniref:Pentatricopeptide repeat-containing protein n=1 Tax=Brassica cretica TaxID=69181 RepID=A0A8S9MAE8_BRACR|nr:hypothetical protein F2Q68_00001418 [Brassica cretica]KAF2615517.1 hypothetical protein F2Q70_00008364 [Brassica cretica]
METGTDDAGTYVMMSNLYSASGKGEEAVEMRMKMNERGLKKQPVTDLGNKTRMNMTTEAVEYEFLAI